MFEHFINLFVVFWFELQTTEPLHARTIHTMGVDTCIHFELKTRRRQKLHKHSQNIGWISGIANFSVSVHVFSLKFSENLERIRNCLTPRTPTPKHFCVSIFKLNVNKFDVVVVVVEQMNLDVWH